MTLIFSVWLGFRVGTTLSILLEKYQLLLLPILYCHSHLMLPFIRRNREEHQTIQNRLTNVNVRNRTTPAMRDMVVLKPLHLGNVSDGTCRRSDFRTAPNYRCNNRDKRWEKDDVITGSGRNFLVSRVPFLKVVTSSGSVLVYLYPGSIRIHVFVTLSDMH